MTAQVIEIADLSDWATFNDDVQEIVFKVRPLGSITAHGYALCLASINL